MNKWSAKIKKAKALIVADWQNTIAYRFSVFAWRIGDVAEVLIVVVMWTAIYQSQPIIKGYTLSEMLAYVLIGNVLTTITNTYGAQKMIANEINKGTLSGLITKPINTFFYQIGRRIGGFFMSMSLSVVVQLCLALVLTREVYFNRNLASWLLIVAFTIGAFCCEWLMAYLLALVAFWITEVDGVFVSVEGLKKLLSGTFFPLTLLPTWLSGLSYFLPFAYTFFVPMQVYLNKIKPAQAAWGLLVQAVWIILLTSIIKMVWKKGLRRYEGAELS